MFCPECGHDNPVPGIACSRCGARLPRTRGATVVVDEESTQPPPVVAQAPAYPQAPAYAPQAPHSPQAPAYAPAPPVAGYGPPAPLQAQPLAQGNYPNMVSGSAQAAPDPFAQTAYAIEGQLPVQPERSEPEPVGYAPSPADSRRGLVWRGVFGGASLLLGAPIILFGLLIGIAFAATDFRYGVRIDLLGFSAAFVIVGILEVVAGARVLRGSPSPHIMYVIALVVQILLSGLVMMLAFAEMYSPDSGDYLAGLIVAGAPLILPLLRFIPLFLSSSGQVLGSREGSGVPMRPVPFVLWSPIVALLASPVLVPVVLSVAIGSVAVWIDPPGKSYGLVAGVSAGLVLGFVTLLAMIVANIGLVRRSRWSVAVGGVAGILVTLLAIGAYSTMVVAAASERSFGGEDLGPSATVAIITTALLIPAIAAFAGAIKFRFRLPGYLSEPEGTERKKLLQLLVPNDGS